MINNFRGEFYYSIDHKGRLSIPKKFATRIIQEEEGQVVVTRGTDNCLWVYPLSSFELITNKLAPISPFEPDFQTFQNTFYSSGHDDTLDKLGRILIPKHLLQEHAQINKDVVIVGAMYRIQLWSPENWQRQMEKSRTNVNEIARSMAPHFSGTMAPEKGTE